MTHQPSTDERNATAYDLRRGHKAECDQPFVEAAQAIDDRMIRLMLGQTIHVRKFLRKLDRFDGRRS